MMPNKKSVDGPTQSVRLPHYSLWRSIIAGGTWCLGWAIGLSTSLTPLAAQEVLDRLDDSLFVQSADGTFRLDLSGRLDLEGYSLDGLPPGLIYPTDSFFFNPRFSLFLDAKLGPQLHAFVQSRADRGFDPGLKRSTGDVRLDEYLIRWTPREEGRFNLQAGKFATVVGRWVDRHLSWENPFITAPVPYENVIAVSDKSAPPSIAGMLSRRDVADRKTLWGPLVWGPSYASGLSTFGRIDQFDYAFEVKNASLSSRSSIWDASNHGWSNPTVSGRLGIRPSASWNFGTSLSQGAYMQPIAQSTLPRGTDVGDFLQSTVAVDASFAWRHLQIWSEVFISQFEIPSVGDANTLAYFVEAKYAFSPQFFGALRWNQQYFGDVTNGKGQQEPWDRDLWKFDIAAGWRLTRHLQTKLQYSYSHQDSFLQQGENLVAAQITLKF